MAVLGRIDHATLCGLAFNADRAEIRTTNRVRMGILAALSPRLDEAWFAALAHDADEAKAMHGRHLSSITAEPAAPKAEEI